MFKIKQGNKSLEFRFWDFGFKHLQNKVEIILKET